MVQLNALFKGKVQGVFFRDTIRRYALHYRLKGFVRNLADGSVELVAQGPRETLDQLLKDIHDHPRGAVIRSCDAKFTNSETIYQQFTVQHGPPV